MAGDLLNSYRNASKTYDAGGVRLVCLDDDSLDPTEYGAFGGRTVVPRAKDEGGIMGLTGPDSRYGKGVLRRFLTSDEHGGFKVDKEIENFRIDEQRPDLFSDDLALEAAGVELPDEIDTSGDLRKQALDMLTDIPMTPATPGAARPDQLTQMLGLMATLVQNQTNTPPKVTPTPPEGKSVMFSGAFGKITVQYADVKVEPEFIVLVSTVNQQTKYEPPMSQNAISLSYAGSIYQVVHLGLSFTYKGDILLLMPIASDSDGQNAQEKQ